ncbi:MAG: histidine phosphatase family protein [Cyanobacteria bacterium P01_G01_bin.39]
MNFVERYEAAGIAKDSISPANIAAIVQKANVVFTSNSNRTIDSATILQPQVKPINSAIFRQIDCWRAFSTNIEISALSWGILGQILWRLKIPPIAESPNAVKQRAKQAAELLIQNNQPYSSIVLVAHGGINSFIAKELILLGWQDSRNINGQHWGCTKYSLPNSYFGNQRKVGQKATCG